MTFLKPLKKHAKSINIKLLDIIPLLDVMIQLTEETDIGLYTITEIIKKNVKSAVKDINAVRKLLIFR